MMYCMCLHKLKELFCLSAGIFIFCIFFLYCMWVLIYIYICVCVYVMYVCMYVCMYVRTYVRMYVCMYVCAYTYIHTHTYIYIYTHFLVYFPGIQLTTLFQWDWSKKMLGSAPNMKGHLGPTQLGRRSIPVTWTCDLIIQIGVIWLGHARKPAQEWSLRFFSLWYIQ